MQSTIFPASTRRAAVAKLARESYTGAESRSKERDFQSFIANREAHGRRAKLTARFYLAAKASRER